MLITTWPKLNPSQSSLPGTLKRKAATRDKEVGQLEIELSGAHCGYKHSPLIVAKD